jgi:hypothetical protein
MRIILQTLMVAGIGVLLGLQAAYGRKPESPPRPSVPKISKLAPDAASHRITATGPNGESPLEFLILAGVPAGSVSAKFEKRTGQTVVNWQPHTARVAKGGQYHWSREKGYDVMYLRIEAEGYQPQIAGPIKKADGPRLIEFQLDTERYVSGRILTPDKQPAAGATVALALVQKDAVVEDGRLRGADDPRPEKPAERWRRPLVVETDRDGRFKLPSEPGPAAVLILHDTGVKEVAYDQFRESPEVVLDAWGRIEGRVLWKDLAGASDEVSLIVHRDKYGYPGMIASYASTQTDKEGRFAFTKVLPGQTQISRPINPAGPDKGVTAVFLPTQSIHADVKAGEPTHVMIGGQGRLLRGKLKGRDSWKGVTVRIHPTAPHIGFPGDDAAWKAFEALKQGPTGPLLFRDKHPVNDDGTFELADMLPGTYQLFVSAPDAPNDVAYVSVSVKPEAPGEKPAVHELGEIKVRSTLLPNMGR